MIPAEMPLPHPIEPATSQSPIAFFCSNACPGDIILKAQDWANTRDPDSAPVVGGFHTPVEREVLRILLRGRAPVVLVLARSLTGWRAPRAIRDAAIIGAAEVIAPFGSDQRRTTRDTAEVRNRHILTICSEALFAHASPGGKTEALAACARSAGVPITTLPSPSNSNLVDLGAGIASW